MHFQEYNFELDDVTKAHITIQTDVPSITTNQLYEELQAQTKSDEMVVKVEPQELQDFMKNLSDEIKVRRKCLHTNGKLRVSKIPVRPEALYRANIVILMPRTLSNQNLTIISNILSYTVPLDIHFYIVLPDDVNSKVATEIQSKVYWTLDLKNNLLENKG